MYRVLSDLVRFLSTCNSTRYLPRNRSVIEDTISNLFADKFINLFSLNVTKVIETYFCGTCAKENQNRKKKAREGARKRNLTPVAMMAMVIGGGFCAERRRKGRLGRIFKHDVAITSDQSGIFHPAPFIRRKRERRDCATSSPFHSLRPPLHLPSYGLLTGNLPRLLLTVLSLYSLGSPSDGKPVFPLSRILPSPLATPIPFPLSLSTARIQVVSSSPRRVVFPLVLSPIDPCALSFPIPACLRASSKFVKTGCARTRGFGHLESLRLQNPSRCILFEDTF